MSRWSIGSEVSAEFGTSVCSKVRSIAPERDITMIWWKWLRPFSKSLIMNHPFIDGNKRVAFFATDVFLRLNGYKIKVGTIEGHTFLIGLLDRGASVPLKTLSPGSAGY